MESARAKHVRFKMTVESGLVVVIPTGFDRDRIPGLVREKAAWIERASDRVGSRRRAIEETSVRPERISFRAIDREWDVAWRPASTERVALREADGERLILTGAVEDPAHWRPALKRWVLDQGREHLIPWLLELADACDVGVKRTSIRCQKTRWGSFSTRGTVSLNAQLLFLPRACARYVLHHELCHTAHPDHSLDFWARLKRFEPDADRLRHAMREAWRYVPGWLSHTWRPAEPSGG